MPASELEGLRDALAARLASLNAPPAGAQPGAAAASANPPGPGAAATQDAASTPPRPACPPSFDMATWKGDAGFADRLVQLRARAAEAHEAAPAMATLAEFYLGNGLAAEALSAVQQAQIAEGQDADRLRLARIADVAHLLRREPIAVASALLAEPADCARADLPLWRALEAAAAHDAKAVAREAEAAQGVLRNVPEPLLQLFTFAIAEAADDNLGVLRAMASAVRNTAIGGPEEEAARFLVWGRIARAEGDAADAAAFLTRAAAHDRTLPGATAKVELAALRAMRDGPGAAPAEMVLADAARVSRSNSLGQTAATYLAEQRLRHGDYAAALAVADASAGPVAGRGKDGRGAALAARILRKLLVEPAAGAAAAAGSAAPAAGPSPAERLALYWRYEGYATPGVQGDDIRLGAARIMLAEDLPAPALELWKPSRPRRRRCCCGPRPRRGRENQRQRWSGAGHAARRRGAPDRRRCAEPDGRPGDAAQQLEGMAGVADRVRRTSLLAAATDWPATEAACDALLHDPALAGAVRRQVADRYSLALALDGGKANSAVTAEPGSLAAGVLGRYPMRDRTQRRMRGRMRLTIRQRTDMTRWPYAQRVGARAADRNVLPIHRNETRILIRRRTACVTLSAQIALQKELDVVADNVANASATGLKADRQLFESYVDKLNVTGGSIDFLRDRAAYIDRTAEPIQVTDNALDVAVQGDGYLSVGGPQGTSYTRNGNLQVGRAARWKIPADVPCCRRIAGRSSCPTMHRFADPGRWQRQRAGARGLAECRPDRRIRPTDPLALRKTGDGQLTDPWNRMQPIEAGDPASHLMQGALEGSTVQPVREIANMTELGRAYEQLQTLFSDDNDRERKMIAALGRPA